MFCVYSVDLVFPCPPLLCHDTRLPLPSREGMPMGETAPVVAALSSIQFKTTRKGNKLSAFSKCSTNICTTILQRVGISFAAAMYAPLLIHHRHCHSTSAVIVIASFGVQSLLFPPNSSLFPRHDLLFFPCPDVYMHMSTTWPSLMCVTLVSISRCIYLSFV